MSILLIVLSVLCSHPERISRRDFGVCLPCPFMITTIEPIRNGVQNLPITAATPCTCRMLVHGPGAKPQQNTLKH
ncbi:hypothetical protein PF005_g1823 [Phytophthora fragariae]|uniref:RxLR effector protein n=1 Tax=Phytophthora fragariae TaxID=53985 RepID=A0A6A3FVQ8_9STRA|nr:hypothetical protein PF003_g32363 [Phytophthora fragariae]KAE8948506.1 hypothetical protein PF009_g1951 [Phytophthora fragariae]KAE9029352.1 hypothetical protein PF011_g1103 [Phytophthora fragariae]KAE9136955.1 hypothetical protein PF010_g1503 [Phytophthora fragariae]KAE9136989.1 hypothetical protein PF007_g1986 [Phytophthora fragariae]